MLLWLKYESLDTAKRLRSNLRNSGFGFNLSNKEKSPQAETLLAYYQAKR